MKLQNLLTQLCLDQSEEDRVRPLLTKLCADLQDAEARLAAAEIEAERLKKNLSDSYAATPPDGFISVKKADLEGMIAEGERNEVLAARVPHLETKLAAAESRLAAMERDGERLDYIERTGFGPTKNKNDLFMMVTKTGDDGHGNLSVYTSSTARGAIDRAQQADAATGETEGK